MTKQEWLDLPRFTPEEHTIKNRGYYEEGCIFEIHTIHKTIAYAKITREWQQIFYDIRECDSEGKLIKGGISFGMLTTTKIADVFEENLWRIFKTPSSPIINTPTTLIQKPGRKAAHGKTKKHHEHSSQEK